MGPSAVDKNGLGESVQGSRQMEVAFKGDEALDDLGDFGAFLDLIDGNGRLSRRPRHSRL